MKKTNFPTPQDAETAFYEAFERGSLVDMMQVWAEDEEIVCIHPSGCRLTGYEAIRQSWAQIFEGRQRLQIHLSHQVYVHGMLLSVHSLHENLLIAGEPKARPPVLATNVYTRTGNGWRLLVHHASLAPSATPSADSSKFLH